MQQEKYRVLIYDKTDQLDVDEIRNQFNESFYFTKAQSISQLQKKMNSRFIDLVVVNIPNSNAKVEINFSIFNSFEENLNVILVTELTEVSTFSDLTQKGYLLNSCVEKELVGKIGAVHSKNLNKKLKSNLMSEAEILNHYYSNHAWL